MEVKCFSPGMQLEQRTCSGGEELERLAVAFVGFIKDWTAAYAVGIAQHLTKYFLSVQLAQAACPDQNHFEVGRHGMALRRNAVRERAQK